MGLFRDNRVIRRAKNGDGFEVHLPQNERELLASLPSELVELLDSTADDPDAMKNDPALARLFPDAYTAIDQGYADEFRRLMQDDLRDRHRASLETMASCAHAERLTHDELYAWMNAIGQLRLVLGTRLGVTEDMDEIDARDPRASAFAIYSYLSWVQEMAVEALTTTL